MIPRDSLQSSVLSNSHRSALLSGGALALAMVLAPSSAHAGDLLFRVGQYDDLDAQASEASDEFAQGQGHSASALLDLGVVSAASPKKKGSPAVAGYLYDDLNCSSCTESLELDFELDQAYAAGDLRLSLARYGSEANVVSLDGTELAQVRVSEDNGARFKITLPAMSAGSHTVAIDYAGAGADNGNHLDYILLEDVSGEGSGSGGGGSELWRLGTFDGQYSTSAVGSDEFAWTGAWVDEYIYDVRDASHDANNPDAPKALSRATQALANSVAQLRVEFDLERSYGRGELKLSYARYGAEMDQVKFNGVELGRFQGQETVWIRAEFLLPAVTVDPQDPSSKAQEVAVRVVGERGDGYHLIDMLKLSEL